MIEVKVAEVSISNIGFALFLRPVADGFSKILPIFIGRLELHAIQSVLEGVTPPRPMTHDLFVTVLDKLNAKVNKVTITDIRDNTFYAELELQSGDKTFTLDARPSDCIALALRQEAPIFLDEEVYEEAGVEIETNEKGEEKEIEDFSEFKSQEDVLEDRLKQAIRVEDYEEAAQIRDQLRNLRSDN